MTMQAWLSFCKRCWEVVCVLQWTVAMWVDRSRENAYLSSILSKTKHLTSSMQPTKYSSYPKHNFHYLFSAALGLHCCRSLPLVAESRDRPSCGLRASLCGGLSRPSTDSRTHRLQQLRRRVQWLWHTTLYALRHVESSWTGDCTYVSSTGRWTLYH